VEFENATIGGNFGFVRGKLGQENNYRDLIFFETLRVFKMFPSGLNFVFVTDQFVMVGQSSNSSGVVSGRP